MEAQEKIMWLLNEKKQCLVQYEAITQSLADCDHESMTTLMKQRRVHAATIDGIDREMEGACQAMQLQTRMLRSALKNACEREALPASIQPIFDAVQQNFSILNRISNLETLVTARLQIDKQKIENRIREGSHTAKIIKYRFAYENNINKGVFLNSKYSKA